MVTEIWKPIAGYEGIYEVSNLGRVRSLSRMTTQRNRNGDLVEYYKEGRLLKQQLRNQYWSVILCKNGQEHKCSIHRLVAEAFVPNPNNLPQVNHKDENKQNNTATNLEWCTCKYNQNYGTRNERLSGKLRGVNNPINKLTEVDVLEIRKRKESGESAKSIAEAFNINSDYVYLIVSKKRWKHI